MGREIVYCGKCGNRILQEDFDQGQAIILHNKNYCPKCKGIAMPEPADPAPQSLSEEEFKPIPVERGKGSSALRRAVNTPGPAATPARGVPTAGRPGGRPPPRARSAARGVAAHAPEKSSSATVIIIVVSVVAAVIILLLVMASRGTSQKPPPPRATGAREEGLRRAELPREPAGPSPATRARAT